MPKISGHYIWFKLALVMGSVLGVVLLVRSITTYYQVSNQMVIGQLFQEADHQISLIPRASLQDPAKLQEELDELRKASPDKIAWIKLVDAAPEALRQGPQTPDIRSTPEGRVLVRVLPLGGRGGPGRSGFRGLPAMPFPSPADLEPGRMPGRQGAWPPKTEPGQQPPQRLRAAQRVEIALYFSGARAAFASLLTNLIVNSAAALGLVASMILLWFRFPNYVRGKHLEQQTELARVVQTDLLPPPTVALENLDFAAECVPAWQVGGDFYDVFAGKDRRIAIVLGDVSGKGLPASVVVGLLLGAIRSSNWLDGGAQHEEASAALSELLRKRTSVERFASLFWCYYEPAKKVLHYVNAGHLPPMVARKNGRTEVEIERLEEGGPVLGVVPDVSYRQGSAAVPEGAVVVLYSDGVVEATNSRDEQYGEDRLRAAISANVDRSSEEIRDAILQQVHSFLGKERVQDDLTLVVARFQQR